MSRHVTSPRLVSSRLLKYDMYAWRKRRVAVLTTPRNPSTFRMSSCAAPTDAKLTSASPTCCCYCLLLLLLLLLLLFQLRPAQ